MRYRILFLPLAAIVIAGLCLYKLNRTYPEGPVVLPEYTQAAPLFEGLDADNELFRLKTYLTRHPILVAFYDGRAGADQSAVIRRLMERHAALEENGVIVVGVSTALPQENRRAIPSLVEKDQEFPFPLVTDVPPEMAIHARYGLVEPVSLDPSRPPADEEREPRTGTFLIEKTGQVPWSQTGPKPLERPLETIDDLAAGR